MRIEVDTKRCDVTSAPSHAGHVNDLRQLSAHLPYHNTAKHTRVHKVSLTSGRTSAFNDTQIELIQSPFGRALKQGDRARDINTKDVVRRYGGQRAKTE